MTHYRPVPPVDRRVAPTLDWKRLDQLLSVHSTWFSGYACPLENPLPPLPIDVVRWRPMLRPAAVLGVALLQLAAGACRQRQEAGTAAPAATASAVAAPASAPAPATPEGGAARVAAEGGAARASDGAAAAAGAGGAPAAARGTARGDAASAHVRLSGAYKVDKDARVVCAVYPNGDLQVSFQAPPGPQVVLRLPAYRGAGAYSAEARVRANYTGESSRQSRGPAQARLTVETVAQPEAGSLISGSFQGTYSGEAGTGEVAGSFERCVHAADHGDRGDRG